MERAAAICLLLWAPVLAPAAAAEAQPELTLRWQAPASCPDGAWAQARIAQRLGRALHADAPSPLRADVRIERAGGGFALQLQTESDGLRGDRQLRDADCAPMADAATLVIALAIDPDAVSATPPPAPVAPPRAPPTAPEPPAPPTTETATTGPQAAPQQPPKPTPGPPARQPPPAERPQDTEKAEDEPSPRPRRPRLPLTFAAGAAAWGDVGTLPALSIGPSGWLALEVARARVELAAGWLPSRTARPDDASNRGRGEISALAISAGGCVRILGTRAWLSGCVAAELVRSSATVSGVMPVPGADGEASHKWWVSLVPAVRVTWQAVPWLGLLAELGAAIHTQQHRFVVVDSEDTSLSLYEVHQAWPVAPRARLGAELRF